MKKYFSSFRYSSQLFQMWSTPSCFSKPVFHYSLRIVQQGSFSFCPPNPQPHHLPVEFDHRVRSTWRVLYILPSNLSLKVTLILPALEIVPSRTKWCCSATAPSDLSTRSIGFLWHIQRYVLISILSWLRREITYLQLPCSYWSNPTGPSPYR